jgi:beta-glucanase (GH16 family)
MKLLYSSLLLCSISLFLPQGQAQTTSGKRQLVWADEFNYQGLPDANKWQYDIGNGCDQPTGCGWGNHELQYYTDRNPKNARVENGTLIIEAHREAMENSPYTSARIQTKGKGEWRYGRVEIRAKVPAIRGSWAAAWMLPAGKAYAQGHYGGWPHSGEIDIMEHVGYLPDSLFGNTHTLKYNGMHGTDQPGRFHLPEASTAFHTFAIDWQADKIDFLVDDFVYHTYHSHSQYDIWPFDQPFYLILNLAVGGGWGGKQGVDETVWPQRMEVDYVRIYQYTQ